MNKHTTALPPNRFTLAILGVMLVLVISSSYMRFTNLGHKVYWLDECFTSLRLSGYCASEMVSWCMNRQPFHKTSLLTFQKPKPNSGLSDIIRSSSLEDPHIPPLYYILARAWGDIFGFQPAAIRAMSALISLLEFPLVFWLAFELFGSLSIACICLIAFALAPIHLLYAQEARAYSLLTVMVLLSSASFLKALRTGRPSFWVVYAMAIAISLYCQIFTLFVAIAHGICLALSTSGNERLAALKKYLLCLSFAFLMFLPWIIGNAGNLSVFSNNTQWANSKVSLLGWLALVRNNFTYAFIDLGAHYASITQWLAVCFVLLILSSIYYLLKYGQRREISFLLPIILLPVLALAVPDLLFGGIRATTARYLIPAYLGCQLTISYFIAKGIFSINHWAKSMSIALLGFILFLQLSSCIFILQAPTWWNKTPEGNFILHAATIINSNPAPLVIGRQQSLMNLLCLSYRVNDATTLAVMEENKSLPDTSQFSNVYFVLPTQSMLMNTIQPRPLDKIGWLWECVAN